MIIQHNIMALNSNNRLAGNNSQVAKNLEKLSSGYKINRAGDDAAGLAISEKMRAQITGLTRASQNAQDGVSLVQTAEGNLTEVHSMLNRMVDLATQSSNGTYEGNVDRKNLQKEVQALKDEINRIADTSNFNGIKLLDGSLDSGATSVTGAKVPFKLSDAQTAGIITNQPTATTSTATFSALTVANGNTLSFSFAFADANGKVQNVTLNATISGTAFVVNGTTYTLTGGTSVTANELSDAVTKELNKMDSVKALGTVADTTGKITFASKDKGANSAKLLSSNATNNTSAANNATFATAVTSAGTDKSYSIKLDTLTNGGVDAFDGTGNAEDYIFEVGGKKFAIVDSEASAAKLGSDVNYVVQAGGGATHADTATALATLIGQKTGMSGITGATGQVNFAANIKTAGGGLNLQIGDTADQRVSVVIGDMGVSALGLDAVDVSNEDAASASMQLIKDAINHVSGTRADLGAVQNRLEHTINNLTTTTENMTAAESRIRDTNMAQEMMAFTKNNVLAQAAQAMLAQANQQPQQVLQLLR